MQVSPRQRIKQFFERRFVTPRFVQKVIGNIKLKGLFQPFLDSGLGLRDGQFSCGSSRQGANNSTRSVHPVMVARKVGAP